MSAAPPAVAWWSPRRAARGLTGLTRALSRRRTGARAADSDLAIHRFLELSTAHLPQQSCDSLGSHDAVIAYRTNYGWLMHVPEDGDDLAEEHDRRPAELLPIITLARMHGCSYVLFDREARQISALPVFEWSSTSAGRATR